MLYSLINCLPCLVIYHSVTSFSSEHWHLYVVDKFSKYDPNFSTAAPWRRELLSVEGRGEGIKVRWRPSSFLEMLMSAKSILDLNYDLKCDTQDACNSAPGKTPSIFRMQHTHPWSSNSCIQALTLKSRGIALCTTFFGWSIKVYFCFWLQNARY